MEILNDLVFMHDIEWISAGVRMRYSLDAMSHWVHFRRTMRAVFDFLTGCAKHWVFWHMQGVTLCEG